MKKGFTILELLFSITILISLVVVGFWYFPKNIASEVLNNEKKNLISIIEEARSLSSSSKFAAFYGVRLESNKAVLFKGNAYNPASPDNKEHFFNDKILASSINLSDSGQDIKFSRLNGEAYVYGSVTLTHADDPALSVTINILETGVIQ